MNSLSAAGSSAASSARKRGHVSRRPRLPGHSSVAEPLGKGPKFADRFDVMVLPASLRCPVVIRHRSETRHAAKMLPSGWCGHAARARTPSSPGAEMTRPVPSTEKLGIGRAGLQASRWPLVHHIVHRDTLVFDDVPRSTGLSAWCALGNLIANCVATVVVAAWEKELDLPLAEAVLDSDVVVESEGRLSEPCHRATRSPGKNLEPRC